MPEVKRVIKLAPVGTNMVGYYRECTDLKCKRLVPCPYIKCQDDRIDFAVKDSTVQSFDPEDVVIDNA